MIIKPTQVIYKDGQPIGIIGGPFGDGQFAKLTSPFGPREPIEITPGVWTDGFHSGDDLATESSSSSVQPPPLYALAKGKCIISGWDKDVGFWIRINTDDGWTYEYYHMFGLPIPWVDDKIEIGQLIGYLGGTGSKADGPHLHITISHSGTLIDPMEVFKKALVREDNDYMLRPLNQQEMIRLADDFKNFGLMVNSTTENDPWQAWVEENPPANRRRIVIDMPL